MAVIGLAVPTPGGVGGFHKATQIGLMTLFFGIDLNEATASPSPITPSASYPSPSSACSVCPSSESEAADVEVDSVERGGPPEMNCPFCGHPDNRVVDSRDVRNGSLRSGVDASVQSCGNRFTTYERVDEVPTTVVKRDGRRDSFDREKLLTGLLRACEKRPVPRRDLVAVVDAVESDACVPRCSRNVDRRNRQHGHRGAAPS